MNVEKNWLEWSVFAVGLALILLVVAYLVYDATTLGDEPPVVEVRLGDVEARGDVYVIPVTLRNLGDRTAESVVVEVALLQGAEEIETAELTIDFLPRESSRSGWVTFTNDPAGAGTMETHVLGYQEP